MDSLLDEVNALLRAEKISTPISIEVEDNVPETVRRLRAARLARKLKRIEKSKGRAGDNHYKRKRMKRREEYHKYDRVHRKNRYKRQFKTHEARYKRIQSLWLRMISKDELQFCMPFEDYSALLSYVPKKLREVAKGVKFSSKYHNAHTFEPASRYANSYDNEDWIAVEDVIHAIVRIDGSKYYTLDNVAVVEVYTGRVWYDGQVDAL